MEDTSFLAPLLLTIGGLVIGALLKSLLRHTRIPYTVGLFAVGLLVGLLNRYGIFNFWRTLSKILCKWKQDSVVSFLISEFCFQT